MKQIGISVIVCCYNSSLKLYNVFDHIKKQKNYNFLNFEILFIDNNSNDDTKSIIHDIIISNLNYDIHYFYEELKGLMNARNKGIMLSKYDYILFCDDDNLLSDNYFTSIYNIFNSNNNISICGGMGIELILDTIKPTWFEHFKKSYAVGSQIAIPQITMYGAGMAIRRKVFDHLKYAGFESFLSGRKGNNLTSGDDGEIVLSAIISGYEIYTDDSFYFYHIIPKSRLTFNYLYKLHIGFGKMYPILQVYRSNINNNKTLHPTIYLIIFLIHLFKSLIILFFFKKSYKKVHLFYTIGLFIGIFKYTPTLFKLIKVIKNLKKFRIQFDTCR
jgi:glycosyltransferase involved in cell wall biosynthesis